MVGFESGTESVLFDTGHAGLPRDLALYFVGGGRSATALSLRRLLWTGRRALLDKETVKLRPEREHLGQ
ncbi:hypothetical protein AAB990_22790 [Burkholderia contaminans]|uniref:hypothetical protein n=1 Tax=Burkholderia contaminans TaxID=488447 RepID=UPI002416DC95|nr:hypothetical protein [Burkholderia contaminans]WFN15728.1 hypothetical protein LXE92_40490 [Burkholderia contaminans]